MKKQILAIIGARPQFIKHFPLELAVGDQFELKTIHTGQHYDANMSQVFFEELGMKKPDFELNTGSGTHAFQTGQMMISIEKICLDEKPDLILVYGDTNSTLAGALVAAKLKIPLAHVEAGLRSYNKEMPEEINRVLTDHVADLLFVPSQVSKENLNKEGISKHVYVVGDIMKDLIQMSIKNSWLSLPSGISDYYYTTIHRPYNTDAHHRLEYLLDQLQILDRMVIFSCHPRTKVAMKKFGLKPGHYSNISFIEPQSYFNNLGYIHHSKAVITDSGGMQKEAYWLKKKCVTIRKETEWKETLEHHANTLIYSPLSELQTILTRAASWNRSLYGQGNTADRICKTIYDYLQHRN